MAYVEKVSRKISDVLDKGIRINMYSPRYYYTKLADLKHEMIKKATEDAKERAEIIATQSVGELGALRDARMGVFQITGQYSDEDYSWGGSFNTADKEDWHRLLLILPTNPIRILRLVAQSADA